MPSRLLARLKKLEAQRYAQEGPHGEGLAALLTFARHASQSTPAVLDADAPRSGLARLLAEAQEAQTREPHVCIDPPYQLGI